MKILVTGGAGFIASHVSDSLLALGHDVAIVDNLASGKRENLPSAAPRSTRSTSGTTSSRRVPGREARGGRAPRRPHRRGPLGARAGVRRQHQHPRLAQPARVLPRARRAEDHLRRHRRCARTASPSTSRWTRPTPSIRWLPTASASTRWSTTCSPTRPTTASTTPSCAIPTSTVRGRTRTARPAWWPSSPCMMLRGQQPTIFGDGTKTRDYCLRGRHRRGQRARP